MQLVAYGAQDIYLSGNPQITFWKVVYRRHTNFARESIEQTISGSSTLTDGNRGTVTISRNGDLLSGVHVVSTSDLNGLGDAAIKDVEVQIGGQQIDKHTKEWMQLWAELTTPDSKADAFRAMTGVTGTQGSSGTGVYATHIPLQFWFCRNPGLALPLIALQYHEVKVVFNWGTANGGTAKVYCDYVYLDTDERRRFAQVSHEYLIEQLQYQTEGSAKQSYKLTLNHPVKALYWTDADVFTSETMKLKLNGHDRFAAREKEYFRLQQPMDCHTAVPGQNVPHQQSPQFLANPVSICALTPGDASNKIAQSSGSVTITLATANQTSSISSNVKVGDVVFVEVIRAASGAATAETAPAIPTSSAEGSTNTSDSAAASRSSVSAHLYVTATTSTTIVGTLSGLDGCTADQGKVPAIVTRAAALNAAGGVVALTLVNDVGNIAAGATTITVDTVSPVGLMFVGEQLFDADGVDCGALATIASETSITRAATKLDGTTDSGAFADNDSVCVAAEVLNVTVVARTQNPLCRTSSMTNKVNMYSFALEPEEHQPSGTCNFSRIDTATLELSASQQIEAIYALNYNVLRIMSGMGGLAYSN